MKFRAKTSMHLREVWVIFFALGLVMLNYPFLHIFNKDLQLLGVPLLILYLFVGWPLSIFIIYLFSLLLGAETTEAGESGPPPQDQA